MLLYSFKSFFSPHAPLAGDLARNPGMCPDWELNQQPFDSQAHAQSTEPHQQGKRISFLIKEALWGNMNLYV